MPVRRGHSGKVDQNQAEIIDGLRKCGISAVSIAGVGGGVPDIIAGFRDQTVLLEVKRPGEQLTAVEKQWHGNWGGQVHIVHSFKEAYDTVLGLTYRAPSSLMQRIDRPGTERFDG